MYCKAKKESLCADYCYGHCFGCGNFCPPLEGMDVDALKKDAYEHFKLHWLMSHNYTFRLIVAQFSEYITELCEASKETGTDLEKILNENAFEGWLEERGFGAGELWPCFEEFCENEWQGDALYEIGGRGGCHTCPVEQCDTLNYRGSRCAALRAQAGDNTDPEKNGTYTVLVNSGWETAVSVVAENANAAKKQVQADMVFERVSPEHYGENFHETMFSDIRVWKET